MARLDLQGIERRFGASVAVAGLDLSIGSGELVSLLGPSGCGKSTTLRLIAGLEPLDGGRILFDGADSANLPVQARRLGLVFQHLALFPHMTVAANIAFGLRVRGLDRTAIAARVAEMLALVQLEGLEGRFPRQLSGGQMQRVALARTLVTDPVMLMLDEPFSSLDANLRVQMRSFLSRVQRQLGITTLLVTHDQTEALELSDRVAVMFGGSIVQVDTPQAVYHRPITLEVARFMGAPNLLSGTLTVSGDAAALACAMGVLPVAGSNGHQPGATVAAMIRPQTIRIEPGETGAGLSGSILDVEFSGPLVRYRVAVGAGELVVEEMSTRLLSRQSPVRVMIDADRIWIFPACP